MIKRNEKALVGQSREECGCHNAKVFAEHIEARKKGRAIPWGGLPLMYLEKQKDEGR